MRAPLNALRADLVRTAREAGEAKAAALFGLATLRERLTAAAAAGHYTVKIDGAAGLDLRETAAAKAAEAWLAEMKLDHKWDLRRGAEGADAAGTYDLVVDWHPSSLAP